MSYPVGEAAILTLLRTLSAYDSRNSSRQNWKILDSGTSDSYVILRPGSWNNEQSSMASNMRTWRTVIEVWRPYRDDTKPATLQADVTTIIEHLEKYHTLNDASGVIEAAIVGGGEMLEVTRANGSLWARWEVYCDWQEEKEVAFV